ncbi:hypothetical protein O181_038473 [Austropuccinia psidii MF-1]|uniref:Uncharacterized protein n=1 Tax=Austropuccinia psidii MF-1 TaxID=1389203 RepID=A0A9Q3HB17_9BASI|nr:hypothetical protein [Austropuccinia psidii MF-1]
MTNRRVYQYSIQSDRAGLGSRIDSSKGKRKGKIPSGTESTQGSAISQRQVPEIPIISEQELELSMSNSNRSDEILAHPEKVPQRGGNSEIIQWMEYTIIQTSNQKIKDYHAKKSDESKEEAPVASTRKSQASQPPQEGKKNKKKNWRKPYFPSYRIPRIHKDSMENAFNIARKLIEFKEKEAKIIRKPHFPKK